jgi:two-component system, NtrC family, sensor histidine kinase HydH
MNIRLLIRMTAPVMATSFLLLTVGVGAAWYVNLLEKKVSADTLENVSAVRGAYELEIHFREIRTQIDHYLLTGKNEYLDSIPPFRKQTDYWLSETERWSGTDHEKQLSARARLGHDRFYNEFDRLVRETPADDLPLQIRTLIEDVLVHEILEPTHEYLALNEKDVEQSIAQNQFFANRLVYGLLILGICGSGAGLVAGFGFARGFNRSLVQLSMPIRDAAGQLDEIVGPITFSANGDLKELETVLRLMAERIGAIIERLRRSEREALHAEQLAAVGQMAAGMAHELRNPLTSMKILVQAALADEGGLATDDSLALDQPHLRGRDLAVLEEEIDRLERLVQTFLQFARPPQLEKKTLDLCTLVREVIEFVLPRAAASGHRVEFAPAQPVWAAVDPSQVRQIVLNLLLNAFDAMGRHGVVLIELQAEADGWLMLRVTDNGCGLPPTLGERIFAPFVTTKTAGLGLGLSICKRIAEAHGGEISGASQVTGGAVFTVRLPVAERGSRSNPILPAARVVVAK